MTTVASDTRLSEKTLLVCVGAQKAGTTWLHANLRRHPEVYLPPLKEMHWFDGGHPTQAIRLERYLARMKRAVAKLAVGVAPREFEEVAAMADYFQLIGGDLTLVDFFARHVRSNHKVFGDFTPAYALMDAEGFTLMRDSWPDTRVVFLMREPVARLVSAVKMTAAHAGRRATDADVLTALADRQIMAYSRYDRTLDLLLSVFGEARVHAAFYENMFTPTFSGGLCRWLGLSDMAFDSEWRVNSAPDPYVVEGPGLVAAHEMLRPVYDYCEARFGDAVPAEWRMSAESG